MTVQSTFCIALLLNGTTTATTTTTRRGIREVTEIQQDDVSKTNEGPHIKKREMSFFVLRTPQHGSHDLHVLCLLLVLLQLLPPLLRPRGGIHIAVPVVWSGLLLRLVWWIDVSMPSYRHFNSFFPLSGSGAGDQHTRTLVRGDQISLSGGGKLCEPRDSAIDWTGSSSAHHSSTRMRDGTCLSGRAFLWWNGMASAAVPVTSKPWAVAVFLLRWMMEGYCITRREVFVI